jgi:hypothetical protein
VIVLGVAVHGGRETGGLAHICLQPLVLLGLALLASQWDLLGRAWQRAIIAGVTVDAVAGIILQFAVENHALDRWLAAGRSWTDTALSYSQFAQINFRVKPIAGWTFLGDLAAGYASGVVTLLIALLILTLSNIPRKAVDVSARKVEYPLTAADK